VKLRRIALVAGLVLFGWLVHRIGIATIASRLGRVGWGFALVLGLEGISLAVSTLAWRSTLPPGAGIPFRSLFAMRVAGDAVNSLAPAAVVGGEILRARLLSAFLPAGQAIASVSVAALAQFLAQVLYVAGGSFAVPSRLLPPGIRWAGAAALLLLALVVTWAAFGRDTMRASTAEKPARFRALFGAGGGQFQSLDARVSEALRNGRGGLMGSVALFLAGWALTGFEVALILALLGSPVPARTAFSISVVMVFVEGVFFFVPARVGVTEGGLYAAFRLFGLDPATGFSLAIVRRARELAWGLAGLAILAVRRAPSAAVEDAPAEALGGS
jgi:uncharacterized membrane protein YbhN (UPF0104 family)